MRMVFCNIAWMKYYRGIMANGVDEPFTSGAYARKTKDALEKYNFSSMKLKKGNLVDKAGKYCLGYLEAKTPGSSKNQLYLEKVPGCELLDQEEVVEDVLVVFCATHPDHKFTTVVGWYKHSKLFRGYQSMEAKPSSDEEESERLFNAVAKEEDCVLLPMRERSRKAVWGVPKQQAGASYGFGRASVWYPQNRDDNPNLAAFIKKISKQINEYEDENWMNKVIE